MQQDKDAEHSQEDKLRGGGGRGSQGRTWDDADVEQMGREEHSLLALTLSMGMSFMMMVTMPTLGRKMRARPTTSSGVSHICP